MKPNRLSNKVKQRQLETKYLQEQTKKMQQKLNELKKQVQQQKQLKATTNFQSTVTRWKKVTRTDAPLKSYAKQVLQQQKQAYKKFGIDKKKITGTQTFSNIKNRLKQQKQLQQQRNPTKIPSIIPKSKIRLSNNSNLRLNESHNNNFIQNNNELPVETIQNNFMKAKMDIKNLIKQKTVLQFLQQIFLQQYFHAFQQNNITELSDLRFLTRQQLQDMGIAKGHQVKILKRIKEEFQKTKSPTKNPFILKKQDEDKEDNIKQQKQQKVLVQMGYGQGDINDYAEIQMNQKRLKQQNNFQSSQQQQQYQQAYSQNMSQYQQNQQKQDENYEQQQNDVVLITVPLSQIALQTGYGYQQQQQDQMNKSIVQNCFSCYKNIPLKNQLIQSPDKRNFCSMNCLKMYKLQMQKTCPECKKDFFKTQGYYQQGFWFCSLGCCPNKNQIQEMFLEWTHKAK